MNDKDQSTASPIPDAATWEAFAVFRETFLANLSPGDAAAYRRLGQRIYLDRMEAFRLEDTGSGEPTVRADLRAAAADLAVLAGFLSSVGEGAEPSPESAGLPRMAQECAAVLLRMENRLRLGLERFPRGGPRVVPSFREDTCRALSADAPHLPFSRRWPGVFRIEGTRVADDQELPDRAAREAAERLLRAMFRTGLRGQVDLLVDESGRAHGARLDMTPEQVALLADRCEELCPPRGLVLRSLARLREIVAEKF